MGNLPWLEIDREDIVGIHSLKGKSNLRWVQLPDGAEEPDPGDKFINGSVVRQAIVTDEGQEKRMVARAKITGQYPIWKQMNIVRNGTATEQKKMGAFIDAVRVWSNDTTSTLKQLEKITV